MDTDQQATSSLTQVSSAELQAELLRREIVRREQELEKLKRTLTQLELMSKEQK